MPVKISLQTHAVVAKVTNTFKKNLPALCEEILNDCNQYCKEDSGTLIASSLIHSRPQEGKLIWQTPYARRQYWTIRSAYQTVNPNAVWRWCEYAKRAKLATWNRQAQRLMEMSK